MATIKPQAPGVPADTRVDNKPAPPVDEVEQAALDAQNNGGDMPPAGYKYGDTIDSSTGKPELIKSPVINTNNVRNKAQENANYVDNKAGTKTVTSTVTSNGKTTKTYSDGTTETTDSGISSTTGTPDRNQILDEQKNIYTDQENLQADYTKRYDAIKVSQDEAYNQLVENTKNQFAALRTKLTDSNRRFEMRTTQGQYLNNGFRYTPQSSEGMVYQAEQAGIARLSDLNLQESIALQKALSAKNDSDYQGLQDYTNQIRGIQQERLATLDSMNTQIKSIEDTDKNIRNMNENEAAVMNSMIDYYILSQSSMSAKESEQFYDKKSKELSELMGFTVAPEFIKAQVEGASIAAKTEINEPLSVANGYYTDKLGRPITDKDGKNIPLEKTDWFTQVIGDTLNVGTYDEDGNRVIKEYKLKGGTKSYADTIKELPPTQTNITAQTLAQTFKGPMADLIVQNNVRIPTTVESFKNLQGGGMQCAEYVNRVAGTTFGSTMEDKLSKATDKSGQVGSIAVWNAGDKEHGHIGIIMADNGDTWTIRSSNLHGDTMVTTDVIPKSAIQGYHTPDAVKNLPSSATGTYDPMQDKNLAQIGQNKDGSPIFYDNKTGKTISSEEAKTIYGNQSIDGVQQNVDLNTLGQFMKDNQDRGTGYSNDDVAAFNEKIDRFIKEGDSKSMVVAYRNMVMKDKDFKKEFDDTTVFVRALDDVTKMIQEYEAAGKSTNAAKAFAEKIARGLGVTTNEALAQLQTQMGFTLANYIRSISGTAASDVEVRRLMGNMASIGNISSLNTAIAEQAKNNAMSKIYQMIDNRTYGLPEFVKKEAFSDIYGAENQQQNTSSQPTGNWFDN